MKKIIVVGNGNSGAKVSSMISHKVEKYKWVTEYYYEFGPHDGVQLDEKVNSIKTSSIDTIQIKANDLVISCGWVHKIPYDIIKYGNCYNLHPSILPKYRGSAAIERQIKNDEKLSGITMHKMDQSYDTGPVFARILYNIENLSEDEIINQGIIASDKMLDIFFSKFPNLICIDQDDPNFEQKVLTLYCI